MPKYAKFYKSGSYNRKPIGYARALTTASNLHAIRMAKKAANAPLSNRGFGSMATLQNREKKFFDTTSANYIAGSDGNANIKLLYVPVLGSDFNNRIGRKTLLKSVYIRGFVGIKPAIALDDAIEATAQQARLIIFVDNQPNGAAPLVTDVLTIADSTGQLNPNNRDRFKVIKDKTWVFDAWSINSTNGYSVQNRCIQDVKIYKKLNLETIFNATNGGTVGDINTGALYMMWVGSVDSNQSVAEAYVSVRCRFDDA